MEEKLLTAINHDWTSPALDAVMAVMSSLQFWLIPVGIIALLMLVLGGFRARATVVVLAFGVFVCDGLVSDSLKHLVQRPRPSEVVFNVRIVSLDLHHPWSKLFPPSPSALQAKPEKSSHGWIRIATSRPDPDTVGGRSFPSSHTLNNFCAALVLTFFYRRFGWLYFFPATLVAYSRVYVGSHWPSDVVISIILGLGVTLLILAFCEWLWRKAAPRLCPRIFARHPILWEQPFSVTPAPLASP